MISWNQGANEEITCTFCSVNQFDRYKGMLENDENMIYHHPSTVSLRHVRHYYTQNQQNMLSAILSSSRSSRPAWE